MSFSSYSTNKTQNIYVLGKDFVQGINGTTIYAEKIYKHNLFVNGGQELKFKSTTNYKDRNLLCVGNISSDWSTTEAKKTGLYGNVMNQL